MGRPTLWLATMLVAAACGSGSGGDPGDGGLIIDGGSEDGQGVIPGDRDAGPPPAECVAFTTSVCGGAADSDAPCESTPECRSARLVAGLEPEGCAERALRTETYPSCEAQTGCQELREKVCGPPEGGCEASSACLNAVDVAAPLDAELCQQALHDESAFPRCIP